MKLSSIFQTVSIQFFRENQEGHTNLIVKNKAPKNLIIHEGQVSSPQSQIFFISFLCYIINMEQPYSYVLYK